MTKHYGGDDGVNAIGCSINSINSMMMKNAYRYCKISINIIIILLFNYEKPFGIIDKTPCDDVHCSMAFI